MNAQAIPKKLKSGAWGALVQAEVSEGDLVTITTRKGKSWDARVSHVFWTDGKVSICQTQGLDRPANTALAEPARATEIEARTVVELAITRGDVERVQDYLLSGNTSLNITQYLGYRYLPHKARTADEWERLTADLRTAFLAVDTPRMRSEGLLGAPEAQPAKRTVPKAKAAPKSAQKSKAAKTRRPRQTRKQTSDLSSLLALKF